MEDKSIIADQLNDLDHLLLPRRRTLLTWWLKVFSYIFLFAGLIIVFLYPIGFLLGTTFSSSLYGLESHDPRSFLMLVVAALFLLKSIASYGLLFEKDWAVEVALGDAVAGIAACSFVMCFSLLRHNDLNFRIEIILLIIYLIKLLKMRDAWKRSPAGTN